MSLKSTAKLEKSRIELIVTVDAETFDAAINKVYKKNIKKINVPGFRAGKAPRGFVEKYYGAEIFYEEAVNEVYPDALDEAIKEADIVAVSHRIDLEVINVGKEGLEFRAVVPVKPEVTVGEYKGVEAVKVLPPVEDVQVAAEIENMRETNSRMIEIEDRAAQNDDIVVIDFDGSVDGVPFDGGKAEAYELTLGSGTFIPGFEDQIVGHNIDDEFDVNVTFPEEYGAEELAGKAAVFACKLHNIKVKELPELDDEFAKDVSEFDTLDELKADIKKHLEEHAEQKADGEVEDALIAKVADTLEGDIPDAMIEDRMDNSVEDFAYRLQSQGLDLNTYLGYMGVDENTFRENFRANAERQVKVRLALEKIAELENIIVGEEELEEEFKTMAEQYKMDIEKVKMAVPADALMGDLVVAKAAEVIKNNANVTVTDKAPEAEKTEEAVEAE